MLYHVDSEYTKFVGSDSQQEEQEHFRHQDEHCIVSAKDTAYNNVIRRFKTVLETILPDSMDYKFKRLLFPLKLSVAMSINKAQAQSLNVVGLNLLQPCFSHGQVYVKCSKVGDEKNLYILNDKHGKTENTVHEELRCIVGPCHIQKCKTIEG
ncbi:uncharacterized protein LOC106872093 [Octopus bimaculoides]|uniref:uncharacterized protein LOC106872093 n=1 Tax=Octopus bimaculoides TaxID=37653 RepID=UPI00071D3191|nr:uncharacterized protein LOC106872093 [Octopus bimaculoides]|eukprot:XP_014774439.1 PREDICTED: uncharacterized protein LOC106872093 [Octopus bimaculoides]